MTGKFNSIHDEYLWEGSVVSGVVTGNGNVEAPTGWFAPITLEPDLPESADERAALAHFGTRWLILHESNEGFVTVLQFEEEVKRNRRVIELDQAYAMYEAGVEDREVTEAIAGYRRTLEWHADLDGQSLSWSEDSQRKTGDEVTDFIVAEIENLRIYMETVDRNWQAVGADFAFARLGTRAGFAEFAGGVVVDALIESATAYGPTSVVVNDKHEMEIAS